MNILLVLNKANREMPIMESIRKAILLQRPDAKVAIREMCVPGFTRFVLRFRPNVILTFPFTSEGFARWYYVFKFIFRSKIASLRAEGVVDFSAAYNVQWAIGFDRYGKYLVDYELFWGRKLAEVVGGQLVHQNKLSSMERVKVVGYSRLESYFSENPTPATDLPHRILDRLKKFDRSKTLFLITGFHLANYTERDLFDAKDLDAENNLGKLMQAVNLTRRFRSRWIENVMASAIQNPDALFVVKKHPIERRDDYAQLESVNNILFIYEDIQIQDVIAYSGIFFHYGSTALVDAYLAGVPAIYVYSKDNGEWYSDLGWPSAMRIEIQDMPATVQQFLSGMPITASNPSVEMVLKDIFNIKRGRPYRPSWDIAKILLDPSSPQRIPLTDPYLWRALASVLRDLLIGRLKPRGDADGVEEKSA